MPGSLSYLGQVSVGTTIPIAATAQTQISTTLPGAILAIQAGVTSLGADLATLNAAQTSLSLQISALQGQLAGLVQMQAALTIGGPPSISAVVSGVQATLGQLQAHVALPGGGLQVSTIAASSAKISAQISAITTELGALAAQLSANVSASAGLTAQISALQSLLNLALSMQSTLATGGIDLFRYDGDVGSISSTIAASIGAGLPTGEGPGTSVHFVLPIAVNAAAWTAMQAAFKTS